ncbi:MAG: response regulator transcription factor [Thermoflexales bacterium]|nr:response regulator transcription factor [Thermoflexales bacterium]
MAGSLLVVDDEKNIVDLIEIYARQQGFTVTRAHDGLAGLALARSESPALMILDLMLPGLDGWEVCRRVRADSDLPIIMLTARDDDVDKIVGLELGADDYVTKPFNPRELLARVKAILRRREAVAAPPSHRARPALSAGTLTVDIARHEVRVAGQEVHLRAKEFDLLVMLLENRGIVLTREKLLEDVWGFDFAGETRTVDVHVGQVRKRIAGSGVEIETVFGVGYKLRA